MEENAKKMLDEAKLAIGGNQKTKAVQLLYKVLESHGTDVNVCNTAWYYLAFAEETVEKRFDNIKKVYKTIPMNKDIGSKFEQVKSEVLKEARNALMANDKSKARQLLTGIIDVDKNNEQLLLLLFDTLETDDERIWCLENIVAINPGDIEARGKLESLREKVDLQISLDESNISEPGAVSEAAPPQTPRKNREMRFWQSPYHTENDVCDRFEENVDELLAIAAEMKPEPRQQIKSIHFAKNTKHEKWKQGTWANIFLVPAVIPAADISEKLLSAGKYQDAFWVSNVFGEMSKILTERNRDKYKELFERLVLTACCAVGAKKSAELVRSRSDEDDEEIKILQRQVETICLRGAFGSFYNSKKEQYFNNKTGVNLTLANQIMNDSLAWNFDKSLQYFLDFDRPQVKGYVWRNIPTVFRLNFSDKWRGKRKEWEDILIKEGYHDLIRDLKDMGILINPDEVGKISQEQLEEIKRAERETNFKDVKELLNEIATDIRNFLYAEAQANLNYLTPPFPASKDQRLAKQFGRVPFIARTGGVNDLNEAIEITKGVWAEDIDNLDLQDWLGFLYAKSGSLGVAERTLETIRKRRGDEKKNFVTDWNLAALAYERKDERRAYQFLLPLIDNEKADAKLVKILLALSHQLGDKAQFLSLIPRTMGQQFLPLAFIVAYELDDKNKQKEILAKILKRSDWQLPPVDMEYKDASEFQKIVNRAIVEDQIDQLVQWLKDHISKKSRFLTPYIELAWIQEEHRKDIDTAFEVLRQRLKIQMEVKCADQRFVESACRDLLELCKRNKRIDLGQKAYNIVKKVKVNPDLLNSFKEFAPELPIETEKSFVEMPVEQPDIRPSQPTYIPSDPGLPERLAWVTAQLTKIQTTAAYVREKKAIDEFINIVGQMNPQESDSVVELIKNITETIDSFTKNENRDIRRVFYDKAASYEKRLTTLLEGFEKNQMLKRLADVLTPYFGALKHVMGDLSKQAGIIPDVEPEIENSFISLETLHSTLVLRITNKSERRVTDIIVNLSAETSVLSIAHESEQKIDNLGPLDSKLLNFPIERKDGPMDGIKEVVFSAMLRASSEGFKDIDMGIKKLPVPVNTFSQVINEPQIKKFFQVGQSLKPSGPSPKLFQGRDDIINKIQGGFQGVVQNERYFLDGIRRVGKTSIINFLPSYLPKNTIPVFIDFDLQSSGLRGPIDSAVVLQNFCDKIREKTIEYTNTEFPVTDPAAFKKDAGKAFQDFLALFRQHFPDKTPLLMIDEFQDLLFAISRTGSKEERDTLVLDQLRGLLDQGQLYMITTGSIRFDGLSNIVQHRIFGSLTRLPISFLSEESVGNVLRAGFESPVKIPYETIKCIYELTGGYPWLVQSYGSKVVDLLNEERRIVATPLDVEYITDHIMLTDSQNFEYWWPVKQLGIDEERFIERLFREYPDSNAVSIKDYFNGVRTQEKSVYMKAFQNLRSCEVLDSTQASTLKIRGNILKRWLLTQMQADNRLKIRVHEEERIEKQGKTGMFIDHENLLKSLERVSRARGVIVPADREKSEWLSGILKRLVEEAQRRTGDIHYKITVAFWSRPDEAQLLTAYFKNGFNPQQPEDVKMANAVDFKLVDEVRRAQQQASLEKSNLGKVIIVSGDGDFASMVRTLINEGIDVQIWGGSHATNQKYANIVGENNIVVIDDVCGL